MASQYDTTAGKPSLHEFFASLYAGVPYDHYTAINGFNGTKKAKFIESYTVDAIDSMVACVDAHRHDTKTNIYYRMAPLRERPATGRRGTEEETAGVGWVWCDLDTYNTSKSTTEAINALENFRCPASFIVHTGRGVQAAWRLQDFCTDLHLIKSINKWIELQFKEYGADSVGDYARVLRVPTTINHKPGSLGEAKIVVWRMDRIYQIGDFEWASVEPSVFGEPLEAEDLPQSFLQDIRSQKKNGELLYKRILSEETAKEAGAHLTDSGSHVDRSANDWFITKTMLSFGYTKEQIVSVLTHDTWFSGARFRQQKNYDYVNRTVQGAAFKLGGDAGQYFELIGDSKTPKFVHENMHKAIVRDGTRFLRLEGKDNQLLSGIWYYHRGIYRRTGDEFIREEVAQRLGKRWAPRYPEDVIKHCREDRAIPRYNVFVPPKKLPMHQCEVNTLSGWVNVATGEVRVHTPDDISFTQIPVRYDPNHTAGVIDTFVRQLLPADTIQTFWEFIGYCLLPDCRFKKALFLLGERDSGKSTILDLIIRFLGQHNAISTSLQEIADKHFEAASLFGALANIYPDLSATELKNSAFLKGITSGDKVKGENKYEKSFWFYPTAKHIYSANAFVPTGDPEVEAYVERWLIIQLEHVFRGQQADTLKIDKLAMPENMSEMLNLALDGLRRLLSHNSFTESESIRKGSEGYRAFLDSVYAWFIEETVEDRSDSGYMTKKEALHSYVRWCGGDANRRAKGEQKFYARMLQLVKKPGLHLREGTKTLVRPGEMEAKETHVYFGRRLKEESQGAVLRLVPPSTSSGILVKKPL